LSAWAVIDSGFRIWIYRCIDFSGNTQGVFGEIFGNILGACVFAIGSVMIMTSSVDRGSHLFFNEISSNAVKCTVPEKQTFKCAVYKNGELISQ